MCDGPWIVTRAAHYKVLQVRGQKNKEEADLPYVFCLETPIRRVSHALEVLLAFKPLEQWVSSLVHRHMYIYIYVYFSL